MLWMGGIIAHMPHSHTHCDGVGTCDRPNIAWWPIAGPHRPEGRDPPTPPGLEGMNSCSLGFLPSFLFSSLALN